ncbi:hypothetical protein MY10362_004995 [Beauveria mimosiformis]
MAAQFVWINGLPGVGKLTVARALCALLPSAQLIDNHSLIDQVSLPRTHASYNAERARVRDAAYSSAVYPPDDDAQLARVVIFTGALRLPSNPTQHIPSHPRSEVDVNITEQRGVAGYIDFFTAGTIGTEWAWAHHAAAARAGRPFLPVYLTCERGENLRRVVRPERGAAGSSKLTDAALVESFMEDSQIYRFPGLGVEIDTTTRGPEETARLILDAMKAQVEGLRA